MTHIKKQTDIGNFPVTEIKTTKPNASLNDTKTWGDLVISRHERKEKTLKRRQKRINKIVKELV